MLKVTHVMFFLHLDRGRKSKSAFNQCSSTSSRFSPQHFCPDVDSERGKAVKKKKIIGYTNIGIHK